jgi:hypothetical protein
MSIQALKAEVEALSPDERRRLAAFLVSLSHKDLAGYGDDMAGKIDDKDPGNWVSLEEFEERLDR